MFLGLEPLDPVSPLPPLEELDCHGGGNSAERPLVSSIVGKQDKLSSRHCSLAVRFVLGLSGGCEQSNPKFTSPVRRRFMCGLVPQDFG